MIPGIVSKLSESIVASTTSIVVKSDIITVTGTTAIATISVPSQGGFSGMILVVPVDGSVATTTAGNINKAVTMIQNQVCVFVYSKRTGKWYPGPIS